MRRRAPEPFADVLRDAVGDAAPDTLLAGVQALWPEVAGAMNAAHAAAVSEREGVVRFHCDDGVFVNELTLMAPDFVEALNRRLEGFQVRGLRFIVKSP